MKKVLLDFGIPSTKEEAQEYIAAQMGFSKAYGKNLDALYDELTSVSEPTAVGIFLPVDDFEPNIDLLVYFDSIGEVFSDAEQDNPNLAVIFGDLALNPGFEDRFDELYEDPYLADGAGGADAADGEDATFAPQLTEEEISLIGDKDIILLDIGK